MEKILEKEIEKSVSFRSEKIPIYLCGVIAFVLETITPAVIKGISPSIRYFVYGSRANTAYAKKYNMQASLAADWDILFDDTTDETVVKRFAEYMKQTLQSSINQHFKHGPQINVVIEDKQYSRDTQTGRYEVQITDPYTPYRKTYDCIGITGCHKLFSSENINYCDIFDSIQKIDDIYYIGKDAVVSESKYAYVTRYAKATNDKQNLLDVVKTKQGIEQKINKGRPLDFDDINALENFEDYTDLFLSSYSKANRTGIK
jgi:hypothetical protein